MEKTHLLVDLDELKLGGKSLLDANTSLYDYLGQAAGVALGKEGYDAAKKAKEPVDVREVQTRYYSGKVMLYRREFLKEYFDGKK